MGRWSSTVVVVSLLSALGVVWGGLAAAADVTAGLVQAVDTTTWSPAAPGPAGVVYLAARDSLLVVDSDRNNLPEFGSDGINLWEYSLATGTVTKTGVMPTDEATGAGYDPATNTLFVSDDSPGRVYLVRPGADGWFGTADDPAAGVINTGALGAGDTEDPAFDPVTGHLFVLSGTDSEIYEIDPVDGVFGNGNDATSLFAVPGTPDDWEGLALDEASGHLLVGAKSEKQIYEITKAGALVRIIDAAGIGGMQEISGLGVQPGNGGSNPTYWVADRGDTPITSDGMLFELTFGPAPATPPEAQDQTVATSMDVPVDVTLTATDVNGDPLIYSIVDNPASGTLSPLIDDQVTYTPDSGYTGPDSFTFRAHDGTEYSNTATISITVTTNQPEVLGVPAQFSTIQAAVDAAIDGDIVLVAPGVYNENVVIGGKSITLASEFLTTGDEALIDGTVIDGSGGPYVVYVQPTVGPDTTIAGLTLRNARDGVRGRGSFSFLNNRVHATGDGIDYENNAAGSPSGGLVRDSVFEANSDDGIDLDDDVAVVIENTIIRNNGDDGIEVRLHDYTGPTLDIVIRDNTITGNREDGIQLIDGSGLTDRSFRIERNVIADNTDAGVGMMPGMDSVENFGGANLAEPVVLANNTIVGNNHGVTGGDNLVLVNNIIANNVVGLKRTRVDSTAAYNLFFGNGTHIQDAITDPGTTLFADPLLNPDYTLAPASPAVDAGTSFFTWNGNTILDLAPADYRGAAPDLGGLEVDNGNLPPVADAGPDQVIPSAGTATLTGIAVDDGLPDPPGSLSVLWTASSGPGIVTFANSNAVATSADFSLDGTYVLRLTADDSQLTGYDELTIDVGAPTNQAPVVDAGSDQSTLVGASTSLIGTASDDGWPNPPGEITTSWTVTSGPGEVSFADPTAVETTAVFPVEGTYVLRLTADDTELNAFDEITITVDPPTSTASVRVSGSSDDAEERASGEVSVTSSDLEMVFDRGGNQTVGVRFAGVAVPQGATVLSASIKFQAEDASSGATNLTIQGQAADNAPTFTSASGGISSRPRTAAAVAWSPSVWPTIGVSGAAQTTPNLAAVVQEIVNRPGWSSSNALVMIVSGAGERVAESYDGTPSGAPLLEIVFSLEPVPNVAPVVDAGVDQVVMLPGGVNLDGSVADDGLPVPPGAVSVEWSVDSGPGLVTFGDAFAPDTSATFSVDGVYVLRLTGDDGALSGSDIAVITVDPSAGSTNQPPVVTVTAPVSGSVFNDGDPVTFTATATDPEDGDLTAGLTWTSDLDGQIGNGGTFTTTTLGVGFHTITARATDSGSVTGSSTVTVTITGPPVNQPPTVDAGPDLEINLGDTAALAGTVDDDGLPTGTLTQRWTQLSGPGTAGFTDDSVPATTATFDLPGTYLLRLTADDGELTASAEATIRVVDPSSTQTIEVRVAADSDDAEERATGSVSRSSSDLELVFDRGGNQTVGMRFNGLAIPQGATIIDAFIQFTAEDAHSVTTNLTIRAEAVDNAATFTSATGGISSRPGTAQAVAWSPAPWTTVGEAGSNQRTPSLVAVVQAVVDRAGWASGNSLVIMITGTGERSAESHNGNAGRAPLLHVEYAQASP